MIMRYNKNIPLGKQTSKPPCIHGNLCRGYLNKFNVIYNINCPNCSCYVPKEVKCKDCKYRIAYKKDKDSKLTTTYCSMFNKNTSYDYSCNKGELR